MVELSNLMDCMTCKAENTCLRALYRNVYLFLSNHQLASLALKFQEWVCPDRGGAGALPPRPPGCLYSKKPSTPTLVTPPATTLCCWSPVLCSLRLKPRLSWSSEANFHYSKKILILTYVLKVFPYREALELRDYKLKEVLCFSSSEYAPFLCPQRAYIGWVTLMTLWGRMSKTPRFSSKTMKAIHIPCLVPEFRLSFWTLSFTRIISPSNQIFFISVPLSVEIPGPSSIFFVCQ